MSLMIKGVSPRWFMATGRVEGQKFALWSRSREEVCGRARAVMAELEDRLNTDRGTDRRAG